MNVTLHLAALPLWALWVLLVGIPTAAAALGPVLVRRHVAFERLSTNNEVAGFKFATVGVVYAVQLAFAVLVVWEKYHDAEIAVAQEAGALASSYRLSRGFDPDGQARLRAELAQYIRTVVAHDWPAMARGGGSAEAVRALTAVYDAALAHAPGEARGAALLDALLGQLDQVTEARRQRLERASGAVPSVVWLVLAGGGVLTIAFTFFFAAANLRAQVWMTVALALLIFTSLFVVVVIDHPFTGSVWVTAEAIEVVLADFGDGPASGAVAR